MKNNYIKLEYKENNKILGYIELNIIDNIVADVYHTFVDEKSRGMGVASKLVERLILFVKNNKLLIKPSCSYIEKSIDRNKELRDFGIYTNKSGDVCKALFDISSDKTRIGIQRFFKTGRGQYAENDLFIGVTIPNIRSVVKDTIVYSDATITSLIKMKEHEYRFAGFLMIVEMIKRCNTLENKTKYLKLYLQNAEYCNNWDLVDRTAPYVFADIIYNKDNTWNIENTLYDMAKSDNMWIRRIAIVGTFGYIKNGETHITMNIVDILRCDNEDLIHKACGWMLREIGKVNRDKLISYLEDNNKILPRTTLRYAIEHLSKDERKHFMKR